jgi:hypothetical protein
MSPSELLVFRFLLNIKNETYNINFLIYFYDSIMNNLYKYQKIYKKFNFIKFASQIANIHSPIKYSPNQKYNNEYFLTCLIDFVKNSVSWTNYKGTIDNPIDGKYLNQIHNKFIRNNVYNEINKQLLNCYLKKGSVRN